MYKQALPCNGLSMPIAEMKTGNAGTISRQYWLQGIALRQLSEKTIRFTNKTKL